MSGAVLDGGRWDGVQDFFNNGVGAVVHWFFQLLESETDSPLLLASVEQRFNTIEFRLENCVPDTYQSRLRFDERSSLFADVNTCIIKEYAKLLLSVELEKSGEKGNGILRVEMARFRFVEQFL